jgi:hypothetical protein
VAALLFLLFLLFLLLFAGNYQPTASRFPGWLLPVRFHAVAELPIYTDAEHGARVPADHLLLAFPAKSLLQSFAQSFRGAGDPGMTIRANLNSFTP